MSDRLKPQFVVYALADARAALQAAKELDAAITLVSPAGAGAFGGSAWFCELIAQARNAVSGATFDSVFDCASEAGDALAAIREGVTAIRFDGPDEVRRKVEDIAAKSGSTLAEIDYARALDLNECADPLATCRAWLAAKLAENST